jgi:hypothetical protein
MHPYLLQAIARQREDDLRRAAQQRGPAGRRGHRGMSRAANAPNTLDTASYPAANRTPLVTADDLFASGTCKVCAALPSRQAPPPWIRSHRVLLAAPDGPTYRATQRHRFTGGR